MILSILKKRSIFIISFFIPVFFYLLILNTAFAHDNVLVSIEETINGNNKLILRVSEKDAEVKLETESGSFVLSDVEKNKTKHTSQLILSLYRIIPLLFLFSLFYLYQYFTMILFI
jgi:hypothetical protein